MKDRRSGEIRGRDGSRIAYHQHGADGAAPLVVLTNGIGTTENFWRHLVDDLKHDHRLVHWDYRGHGGSARSTSGDYALTTHADDLARVVEAVHTKGSPPPVHVAFSMGVAVVLELYRRRPELVRGLALVAGAPDAPGTGTWLFAVPGSLTAVRGVLRALKPVVPLLSPLTSAFLRSKAPYPLARAFGVLQPHAPKEDIEQLVHGLATMDPLAYWESLRALLSAHASDVLPTITVPTAIVAATKDVMMPLSQVRRMKDAVPHATYEEIDRAGHAGLVEQGPRMVKAVRELLARAERG